MVHVYMYVPLHVGLGGHLHGVRVLGKVAVGLSVEDVRDTWDGVGNTAVVTKATPMVI